MNASVAIICSDNGLSPYRRQAIVGIINELLSMNPKNKLQETWIKIHQKKRVQMSPAMSRHVYSGVNMLNKYLHIQRQWNMLPRIWSIVTPRFQCMYGSLDWSTD